jgi:hypothetical protein
MSHYKVGVAVVVRWNIYVEADSTTEAVHIAEEEVTGGAIGFPDWQMDMFDAEPVDAHIWSPDPDKDATRWQKVWCQHDPYTSAGRG